MIRRRRPQREIAFSFDSFLDVVANVVGLGAPDFWPLECAPRHDGMLNVLFIDGSVRDFAPTDIDPRVAETYRTHWLPQALVD